jgi:hypothetical protein
MCIYMYTHVRSYLFSTKFIVQAQKPDSSYFVKYFITQLRRKISNSKTDYEFIFAHTSRNTLRQMLKKEPSSEDIHKQADTYQSDKLQ